MIHQPKTNPSYKPSNIISFSSFSQYMKKWMFYSLLQMHTHWHMWFIRTYNFYTVQTLYSLTLTITKTFFHLKNNPHSVCFRVIWLDTESVPVNHVYIVSHVIMHISFTCTRTEEGLSTGIGS